jgi:hypothetical protein
LGDDPNDLNNFSAFRFRVKQSKHAILLGPLDPETKVAMLLQNVGNSLPGDKASHSRKLDASATLLL